jgi:hypothetical protein
MKKEEDSDLGKGKVVISWVLEGVPAKKGWVMVRSDPREEEVSRACCYVS